MHDERKRGKSVAGQGSAGVQGRGVTGGAGCEVGCDAKVDGRAGS